MYKRYAIKKENSNSYIYGGLIKPLFSVSTILIMAASLDYARGNNIFPPYTDYCKMLEKDISGVQHGFIAGNKMYYVGGQTGAFWEGILEEETIGFTHPFFRDMRSRGFGIINDD